MFKKIKEFLFGKPIEVTPIAAPYKIPEPQQPLSVTTKVEPVVSAIKEVAKKKASKPSVKPANVAVKKSTPRTAKTTKAKPVAAKKASTPAKPKSKKI